MQSEYYHLRRTAIKDLAAYCGFLLGFLGSAPFAWEQLASQLDEGKFARGLWYFFGIVTAAGIFAGIAGLGIGFVVGLSWEQIHRFRRNEHAKKKAKLDAAKDSPAAERESGLARAPAATGTESEETPRLRLVTPAEPFPDLTGRRVSSVRFHTRGLEIDFGGLAVEISGNPIVTAGQKRFRYPESGSRDALCALIGARVERMRFTQGDRTEIRFDTGWELAIARSSIAVA
ncbi:MAG TPA: hypothetical protein VFC35_04505 [Gemmatimonadaceae bacterium]|nr:hypothetical protein [Gemmatimonadaceae bacterium]